MTVADVSRFFQPAREVVPPGNRDRLIDDANRGYMAALGGMQRAMARLETDRPSSPDLALHDEARRAAEAGLDAVRQISQKFTIQGAEGVDLEVKRLLESPFRHSLRFVITDPTKAARDKTPAAAVPSFRARLARRSSSSRLIRKAKQTPPRTRSPQFSRHHRRVPSAHAATGPLSSEARANVATKPG